MYLRSHATKLQMAKAIRVTLQKKHGIEIESGTSGFHLVLLGIFGF